MTKLDKVKYGAAAQAETVRKMVVAMARDIRVLVIKLADRLHNMRTLRYVSATKCRTDRPETLEIYVPLAHRLGMNTLKWELEDLAFAALYLKMYDEIVRLVAERAPSRDEYLVHVIEQWSGDLRVAKIKATVNGRPTLLDLPEDDRSGSRLHRHLRLVGIRILVESVRDCYGALGTIHAGGTRTRAVQDFIAMPKFNMYQSLHTSVIGPGGKPVERRSVRPRCTGERSTASPPTGSTRKTRPRRVPARSPPHPIPAATTWWLRQLLDWQKETEDPGEFLESLRFDLNANEVFVFTPKGDVTALPSGSTPIDFAYAVHTEVGHRCIVPGSTGAWPWRATSRTAIWSRSSPRRHPAPRRAATG